MNVPRTLCRSATVFVLMLGIVLGSVVIPNSSGKADASGNWTTIPTSQDTRIVYVSSSQGSDSNNGLSASAPVQTLTKAASLMRDGYPDHMLLKRGDVWVDESLGRFKNGRNASEPMVISYYGSSGDRPLIKCDANFIDHNGQVRNYVWLIGLDIKGYKMDPNDPGYDSRVANGPVIRFVGGGSDILIEDCKLEFMELVVQSNPAGTNVYSNFKLRRSIVVNAYTQNSSTSDSNRPSGIFASGVDGLLIEDNVFDHNGWNEQVAGAGANEYNHNMYLQYDSVGSNTIVRGNIVTRGSSHGVQGRSGGLFEDNFFEENSLGLLLGGGGETLQYDATARNNVILRGKRMDTDGNWPRTLAVVGLDASSDVASGVTVTFDGNIVANRKDSGSNSGITNGSFITYVNGNIQYNWGGGIGDMGDPGWADPDRSAGSYNSEIRGGTGTLAAFIDDATSRGVHEWPTDLTAYALNDYVRDGFTVAGPQKYEAEDAQLTNIAVHTDHTGYTGTGFASFFPNTGVHAVFNVSAPSTGSYDVSMRYANRTGSTQTISIYVNGVKIKQTSLPDTGNWNTWGSKTETLSLNSGGNTISYKYDSGDTATFNMDYIIVSPH
ncbi:carbohydrate-binding protein [Paenibacillus sp. GCM10023250]|uniref:carbohydrate-binding protein n=1 Tax=Paenibacillus sp. GCM10023250 TaxID=3252648 RepID=UPI00361335A1